MKIRVLSMILIVCLIVLSACSNIDYGTVIEKKYTPAHRQYSPIIIAAKTTRIIPRWINHPDNWEILVQNENGREWWTVSEEIYNGIDIGEEVDRREGGERDG